MNTIHSIDGYLLRSVIRRASFDSYKVNEAIKMITAELELRKVGNGHTMTELSEELQNMLNIYQYSNMLDVSLIDYIEPCQIGHVPTDLLIKLVATLSKMLELGSSPVLTVHDAFRAHPNHCNTVRYHYKEIMAELAESNILQFIVSQITKQNVKYVKKSKDLASKIRASNYAIC